MINRPKVMISVFIFNSEGNKIFVGKKYDEGTWSTINGKLNYGEELDECAIRILASTANIFVDQERLNFVCTYNAVDRANNSHIVSIDYYIQVSKEEEKLHFKPDQFHFQSWNWYSVEEILKMYDNLYSGLKVFFSKFNIQTLEDIKTLISN
jgi:ADP-ribose pyrophosphatase YjhB (NUDIX family)